MKVEDLKINIIYMYCGESDGCNILFTVKKDSCMQYKRSLTTHWRGNNIYPTVGGETNEGLLLKVVEVGDEKTITYFNACMKAKKDVGGYDWHDSNVNRPQSRRR